MDTSERGTPERPAGETTASPQRPAQRLAGPALRFDLAAEAEALRAEEAWGRFDRNAKTLSKEGDLRVVLTALKPGARLAEHRADAHVVVQTVSGRVRLRLPDRGETAELPAGHVLVLEPGVAHQVEALEGSVFLLTVARASGGGDER